CRRTYRPTKSFPDRPPSTTTRGLNGPRSTQSCQRCMLNCGSCASFLRQRAIKLKSANNVSNARNVDILSVSPRSEWTFSWSTFESAKFRSLSTTLACLRVKFAVADSHFPSCSGKIRLERVIGNPLLRVAACYSCSDDFARCL